MAPFEELQVLWQSQPEASARHFDAAAAAGAFRRYGRRQDAINIAKSIALVGVTVYSVTSMRHRPMFLFATTLILFSAVLALIAEWRNQRAIASFDFSAPSIAFARGAIARLQKQRNPFHTREFAILFGAVFVGYNVMVVASYGKWTVPQRAVGHAAAIFLPAMIYVFARWVRARRWETECRPLVERLTSLLETLEERAR
jgi:hypothetical protein